MARYFLAEYVGGPLDGLRCHLPMEDSSSLTLIQESEMPAASKQILEQTAKQTESLSLEELVRGPRYRFDEVFRNDGQEVVILRFVPQSCNPAQEA